MKLSLDQVREDILTGDVLLFRGRASLWGAAIKLRTLSRFSHVGIALRIRVGHSSHLCVIEAKEGVGVRVMPLEWMLRHYRGEIDWFSLRTHPYDQEMANHSRERVAGFLLDHWGSRYASAWQFIRAFFVTGRAIGRWLGLPIDADPDRFFCSEAVAEALSAGGFCGGDLIGAAPQELSPGDIAEFTCLQRMGTLTP